MFNGFQLNKYQFNLEAKSSCILPIHKGGTLRGSFGNAFRQIVCFRHHNYCKDCEVLYTCVYSLVFEPQSVPDNNFYANLKDVPRPFLLNCLNKQTLFQPGDILELEVTLIGDGNRFLPYFIYAFEKMSKLGLGQDKEQFRLTKVMSCCPDSHRQTTIYKDGLANFSMALPSFTFSETDRTIPSVSDLSLEFLTPTRLKYDGKLSGSIECHILVRSLIRRLSALYYFYHHKQINVDLNELFAKAKAVASIQNLRWESWERFSNRQNSRVAMGGLVGMVRYQGELSPFWSLLKLGELVHVGKGTVFGLGSYRIVNLTSS